MGIANTTLIDHDIESSSSSMLDLLNILKKTINFETKRTKSNEVNSKIRLQIKQSEINILNENMKKATSEEERKEIRESMSEINNYVYIDDFENKKKDNIHLIITVLIIIYALKIKYSNRPLVA